jgi:DNA primase
MIETKTTYDAERHRMRRAIPVLKDSIRIEQVAAEYTELKLSGPNRLLGRCPSPEHTDRTPSFTIFVDEQRFKCFGLGCGLAGDVIDLEEIAGKHGECWTAVIDLATRYNISLPDKPPKWRQHQNAKGKLRKDLREIRAAHYRRHLFWLFRRDLAAVEDPELREEEARHIFDALEPVARRLAYAAE